MKDEGTKKGTYRGERIHREPMDYVDRRDITVELEEGGIQIYDEALVGRIEMKPAKPGGRRKTKQRKIKRKRTRRATR